MGYRVESIAAGRAGLRALRQDRRRARGRFRAGPVRPRRRSCGARHARSAAEQRLQIDIRLLSDAELQQRLLAVAERARDQQVGELLDAHVVYIDRLVVPLAAVGDGVLERGDAALQLHEVLVGAQLGVGLGDREDLPQPAAQQLLGGTERGHVVGLARLGDARARLGHARERVLLELLVLAAHLDQLGEFVVALLEQHVDVGPGLGEVVLELHQAVVDHHAVHQREDDEAEEDCAADAHCGDSIANARILYSRPRATCCACHGGGESPPSQRKFPFCSSRLPPFPSSCAAPRSSWPAAR